jgi:hypothetical protein
MGAIVGYVGKTDSNFVVTNAGWNEAPELPSIKFFKINHPTEDPLDNQSPVVRCMNH